MRKPILKKRVFWVIASIVLIGSMVGFIFFTQTTADSAEGDESVLQTSKVRQGDLVVSAAGSGSMLSSAQAELGFRSNGIVSEVYVFGGQEVKKGDILATLDNTIQQNAFVQAEANINALFSPAGIAAYQIEVANAEIAYNDAYGQSYMLNYPRVSDDYLAILRSTYISAQEAVVKAEGKYSEYANVPDDNIDKVKALAALAQARINLRTAQANLSYSESNPDTIEATIIQANLDLAEAQLAEARIALSVLQAGDPNALVQFLSASDGTSLSKLKQEYLAYENARIALDKTLLIAPFDGVVVNIDIDPGQIINTNPVLTLASMDTFQVKFYMDETDLAGLAVGNRTLYTINAYPETILEGEVIRIERALKTVDGSLVVVVWGSLPDLPSFDLLSGMTVDVEIIFGEAHDAFIVPVQALRELTPGSYAVFVVQTDGSLKLTPVTIGLRDFANVEILSGLEAGDIVSTGTVETK